MFEMKSCLEESLECRKIMIDYLKEFIHNKNVDFEKLNDLQLADVYNEKFEDEFKNDC